MTTVYTMNNVQTMSEVSTNMNNMIDHTELCNGFQNVTDTINQLKSNIQLVQVQLRTLEKVLKRDIKQVEKQARKSKTKQNRKPSGFATPSKISDELCEFLGYPHGTELARTEVTQSIIKYIKENNLSKSRDIFPDNKLSKLLNTTKKDSITYFNLQKYMNIHFKK